ncbi:Cysteine-rich receptor-like protein kinase 10, partial [Bienertia sinuspersici]
MEPTFKLVNNFCMFLTFTAHLLKSANSQFTHSNCSGDGQFDQGSEYQINRFYLLTNLTSKSGSQTFYNVTTGDSPNKVYGIFHCFYGIDNDLCQSCVQTAEKTILQDCESSVEAIVWHDKCLLRYANRPIYSINDVSIYHHVTIGPANYSQYNQERLQRLISLFDEATSGCSPLASAITVGILEDHLFLQLQVECTPDLKRSDCRRCLQTALSRFDTQGHVFELVLQPSCAVQSGFLDGKSRPPEAEAPDKKLYIGMGVTSGTAAIGLILNVVLISCLKKKKIRKTLNGLEQIENMDNLHLELDVIKTATGNFSEANKLGEGGFGIVYMGTLGDGQVVAVKRLSEASRQGIREFKTEACLAAKLQHKNLVKVYGFCLERDEMLLIYEFVPNKSLDRFLFDAEQGAYLNWETRYKIIVGIARGLQYLHEDSRPKIIHRDLKSTNILLDGEMNPKIADFGMAKLFEGDQTQGNTSRIAGTFGYMAPEYVTSGHISIKSDIFSYGIILLEIVSGSRIICSNPNEPEDNLLHYAWRLWNERKHLNLVDRALGNNFSVSDIERCIHVGLLCTQEDPTERPNMASVLIMLNTDLNIELSSPTSPPAFLFNQETTAISHGSIGIPIEDVITELSP